MPLEIFGTAPHWHATRWFNSETPMSLDRLRDRVVVLHAFQMLCPACVLHGLPQAQSVHESFDRSDVAVIGLHTVFEHKHVMTPDALDAFIHEYRFSFPIGVDEPDPAHDVPRTMRAYRLRGTPSLVLIDRLGRIRRHCFGQVPDLRLGAEIAALVGEKSSELEALPTSKPAAEPEQVCNDDGCAP